VSGPRGSSRRRIGRVEAALTADFRNTDIPAGGRAHLRYLARLCDTAEALEDVDAGAKVGRAYLEARTAYGLAGVQREALDPFAAFVAGMSAPGLRHEADT
jgi:hypothetical protein